ncbi:MAG: isoprenoid biosynthesis glyoxalase ElbB [Salinivirgaceae bacterium]|jgi:enhancing lycopene biosynthesis protein 2|nr:isoprenoid biosynthesis glyoxalase ElbB [Salinivirgaceae bacterium]
MSKKFAVVLSGSGVYDGAEIHEATLSLLAIDKQGAKYQCFAPDIEQHHVINHITGDEMSETRNVLVESARIARGNIKPLSDFKAVDYDILLFPGGFGAAKNLSSLAFKGADCSVDPEVEKAIIDMVEHKKPIGALCIAPAVMTCVLKGAMVTIGSDDSTIGTIKAMGGTHQIKAHGEITIDEKYKLVTTPCYMLDSTISQIAEGAENVVETLLEL